MIISCWLITCNDRQDDYFPHKLYFDPQGDKTDDYVEGGIQIEYNRNDLTQFAVINSTLATYTYLLYSVRNNAISDVRVTVRRFVDSEGNITPGIPTDEKTQFIDFESAEQPGCNYKQIGCDAWEAIIKNMAENQ